MPRLATFVILEIHTKILKRCALLHDFSVKLLLQRYAFRIAFRGIKINQSPSMIHFYPFFIFQKAILFYAIVLTISTQDTLQTAIDPVQETPQTNGIREKRYFFTDYDGGFPYRFPDTNELNEKKTEAVQQKHWPNYHKPKAVKTDPEFDRRLAIAQDKLSFSPFLRTFIKYFIKNREQRERRDISDEEMGENGISEDYNYDEYEYEEPRHHFHPIPVFK